MTHSKIMVPVSAGETIGPDKFGPSLWQGLHYITLGYPNNPTNEQKEKYKTFFTVLQDTIPCSICANHYAENIKILPLTDKVLENKENLVRWLIDIHNIVNKSKDKPIIKYEIARKMIDTDKKCVPNIKIIKQPIQPNQISLNNIKENVENNKNNIDYIYILIALLFSLIIIAILFKNRKRN